MKWPKSVWLPEEKSKGISIYLILEIVNGFEYFYRRAKTLLRKKKYQEKLLTNADAQIETIEKLASDIEFAQVEAQVISGLKVGNEALKKVNEILSIEEVEQILDETRESIEKQQEIDALLNGVLTEEDEDEVLAELEELVGGKDEERSTEREDLEERLPDVPEDEPVQEKKRKERGMSLMLFNNNTNLQHF